jgi:hypothetical protein
MSICRRRGRGEGDEHGVQSLSIRSTPSSTVLSVVDIDLFSSISFHVSNFMFDIQLFKLLLTIIVSLKVKVCILLWTLSFYVTPRLQQPRFSNSKLTVSDQRSLECTSSSTCHLQHPSSPSTHPPLSAAPNQQTPYPANSVSRGHLLATETC